MKLVKWPKSARTQRKLENILVRMTTIDGTGIRNMIFECADSEAKNRFKAN